MNHLAQLRSEIDKRKGNKEQLEKDIESLQIKIRENRKHLKNLDEARTIIQIVGQEIQKQLKFHISDIASLALDSIFSDPYKLVLNFQTKRNKTECEILFERNGAAMKPKDSSGGGSVDIAAFALRIASWAMQRPRSRPTIILDEPFKNISVVYREDASSMIKEISKRLGVQFIIVTHMTELAQFADKGFRTSIKKGITKVT